MQNEIACAFYIACYLLLMWFQHIKLSFLFILTPTVAKYIIRSSWNPLESLASVDVTTKTCLLSSNPVIQTLLYSELFVPHGAFILL